MSGIQLSSFYGIEIDDFAHEVAILSLWIAEHQMNKVFEQTFGYQEPILPLKKSGHIIHANSLRVNWNSVCPQNDDSEIFIIGNPPFSGRGKRDTDQIQDIDEIFSKSSKARTVDYVACWFVQASRYAKKINTKIAFVATNSICQGEQVNTVWNEVLKDGLNISFAYPSFVWKNSAKNNAAVHCVIVGLSRENEKKKIFYDGFIRTVEFISPYLTESKSGPVKATNLSISGAKKMIFGSMPNDGGHLLLNSVEKFEFIDKFPEMSKWVKQLLGADEFLYSVERFCFWLQGVTLKEIEENIITNAHVQRVKILRQSSKRPATRRLADEPHLFGEIRQPSEGKYLLVPCHSSENRQYIPIGFIDSKVICTNANLMVPNATLYDFGILTSMIHNDWMRCVAGRLESRYRYSATLVYNTFPWPEATEKQKENIEKLAEEVLLAREDHPELTLAQLYDPDKMPAGLRKAHQDLDVAVDLLYRKKPFKDSSERLALLFEMYQKLISKQTQCEEAVVEDCDD